MRDRRTRVSGSCRGLERKVRRKDGGTGRCPALRRELGTDRLLSRLLSAIQHSSEHAPTCADPRPAARHALPRPQGVREVFVSSVPTRSGARDLQTRRFTHARAGYLKAADRAGGNQPPPSLDVLKPIVEQKLKA